MYGLSISGAGLILGSISLVWSFLFACGCVLWKLRRRFGCSRKVEIEMGRATWYPEWTLAMEGVGSDPVLIDFGGEESEGGAVGGGDAGGEVDGAIEEEEDYGVLV